MSRVDVLEVLDPASHLGVKQSAKNDNAGFVDMRDWGAYLGRTKDARSAVAEVFAAAHASLAAHDLADQLAADDRLRAALAVCEPETPHEPV